MQEQLCNTERFSLGTPRLYTAKQVANCLGIGLSTVWDRNSNDPDFPKSFKLSAKQTRWTSESLEDFIHSRKEQSKLIH